MYRVIQYSEKDSAAVMMIFKRRVSPVDAISVSIKTDDEVMMKYKLCKISNRTVALWKSVRFQIKAVNALGSPSHETHWLSWVIVPRKLGTKQYFMRIRRSN